MPFKNLPDLLKERSSNTQEQLYFVSSKGDLQGYTYASVLKKSQEYAQHLIRLGIKPGERVAIVLPTCVEFFYCFYGAQIAGAIPFAIYPPIRLAKVDEWQSHSQKLLELVETKVVLTNAMIHDLLVAPTRAAEVKLGLHKVEEFGVPYEIQSGNEPSVHEIAFLQYSSGSTGTPKPIAITHANALHNALEIWRASHLKPEDVRLVSWLPLYHDMGLIGTCMSSLRADGKIYLIRPENFIGNPFLWLSTISKVKGTVTVAPNFSYGLCVRRVTDEQVKELDLSSLQMAGCGAEMIHPATMSGFLEKFKNCGFDEKALRPCYGLAEATLCVTFVDKGRGVTFKSFDQNKLVREHLAAEVEEGHGLPVASVGRPVGDTELKILNSSGEPCEEGQLGRLFVKSPSIMYGYFGMDDRTEEVKKAGWLDTQDRAFLFDGELYIVGREKDTIIIRGTNIDPTLIERCLLDIEELRTGCYTAFSSYLAFSEESQSEGLIVVCELKNPKELSVLERSALEEKIKKLIAKLHKIVPEKVEFLTPGSIPRTSSGKIKRAAVKELWENGALHSEQSSKHKTALKVGKAIVKGKLLGLVGRISGTQKRG